MREQDLAALCAEVFVAEEGGRVDSPADTELFELEDVPLTIASAGRNGGAFRVLLNWRGSRPRPSGYLYPDLIAKGARRVDRREFARLRGYAAL